MDLKGIPREFVPLVVLLYNECGYLKVFEPGDLGRAVGKPS